MLQNSYLVELGARAYQEVKFWSLLGGGLWSIFKVVNWFKLLKTNDLHHIQVGIEQLNSNMSSIAKTMTEGLEKQTEELKGIRNDLFNMAMHK